MDDTPDYSKCSLDSLYDIARHIDKEKYADRHKLVVQEIVKKEQEQVTNPAPRRAPMSLVDCCYYFLMGGILGGIVGGGIGFGILLIIIGTAPANTNWDHATGLGGLAYILVPPGAVLGAIIGVVRAFKQRE